MQVEPQTIPTPRDLLRRYRAVRAQTLRLLEPLAPEDCTVQSMPDASPTRWHLAHTTWFFETFVLARAEPGCVPDPAFQQLFNSYYQTVGEPYPRAQRGLLSRPTLREVLAYRRDVDARIEALLGTPQSADVLRTLELGVHHEQQHQELILTDIKHALSHNPLLPAYRERRGTAAPAPSAPAAWVAFPEGIREIGHQGAGFAFDNELPRHRVLVPAFELATRPVTSGEMLAFVDDGGYRRPELWLDEGWATVKNEGWRAPLYWMQSDGAWWQYTLAGRERLALDEPVCHVSYYEADAYARWAGARLPTEHEWETAAAETAIAGNFLESDALHPRPAATRASGLQQMFGDVWEWTASAYAAYPGYRPPEGALGEYNGKFMCSQLVLRGGSCATPRDHVRATYRNFFHPDKRWQFSGVRLAR
jgi:ergothioneine biosynthesis protein EgtB